MAAKVRAKQCPQKASASRHVILFLAASPSNTSRLAFDEECAAIERELRMTEGRDEFDFRSKWAVTVDEMMRHLNELRPTVIHFSGHGRAGARSQQSTTLPRLRGDAAGSDTGLYLQDEHGNPQLVTAHALKMMVKTAASARVVVLNACYSVSQANALRTVVDCVVGMTGAIRDDAARSFAVGFYRALGNHRSIGNAVEQAIATLAAKQLRDEYQPRCRTRPGINARQIFLHAKVRRRS
jgi:CHAT domain-containing protein